MGATVTKAALAALLATAVGIGTVAAVADEDGSSQPPGSDLPVATAIDPEATAAIAKLAQARGPADELPSDVAERAEGRPLFGINPDLSRRAIANTAESLYLVPGDGHVCAVLTHAAGAALNCDTTDDIADGLSTPATVVLTTGDVAVYGIASDAIESVTVATGTATTDTVEVEDNAYLTVIESETALRHVAYEGPSGPVQFPIVDPSAY